MPFVCKPGIAQGRGTGGGDNCRLTQKIDLIMAVFTAHTHTHTKQPNENQRTLGDVLIESADGCGDDKKQKHEEFQLLLNVPVTPCLTELLHIL